LDGDDTLVVWFSLTRAVHFGACLLALGACAFDRFVADPVLRRAGPAAGGRWDAIARWLAVLALPAALLSGAAWFAFVAIQMSGLPPSQALRMDVLRLVWGQTRFGELWRLRAVFWALASVFVVPALFFQRKTLHRCALTWASLICTSLLAGSLAWAGHGRTGGAPAWHLLADALHIVVGGFWPAGLLPFLMLAFGVRRLPESEQLPFLAALTRRFSTISLASVALLATTGIANTWFLVGSISDLYSTQYGRVLSVKIALFCAMVGVGAVNLLILMPRLSVDPIRGRHSGTKATAARLRWNVMAEIFSFAVILLIVGILGLLPPAAEGTAHHHHHHESQATDATATSP
jgi:putative copper resistance protein D